MKLGETVEMILGTVIDDADPKKLGRVKVGAPGVFDRTTMSIKAIPWVYPLNMGHMQSYTHMSCGSKVWLIINKENQEEFWYIPYHELNEDTKAAIADDVESDVVFSRNICGKLVQIYNNKEEGIVIKNGTSKIALTNEGQIIGEVAGEGGACVFKIDGNNFYCGAEGGAWHQMVKGDVMYDILNGLVQKFGLLSTAAKTDHASALADPFNECAQVITDNLDKLLTERAYTSD